MRKPEDKINTKNGKHYIKESYYETIQKAVKESEELHKNVIEYWFGRSETLKESHGYNTLTDWFERLLINFFKDYSYDWIHDLKSKRNGKKKSTNIDHLIDASFDGLQIIESDHAWLKKQFIQYIESSRKEDDDLLWIYGSSMFTATLLTARNYADDFGLEIFKDSDFILDTNILMILELEGFEHSFVISTMEEAFKKLNISTKYFYISKEEYSRAIGPKRDATLASIKKYDLEVIRESDCPFVQTALRRQCRGLEDFERFFDQLQDPPTTFGTDLALDCEDSMELQEAISKGENDEQIKSHLHKIHKRRTNHEKRERPKQHDAGLIVGAEFKKKTRNCWILTRDGTLRELASDRAFRDENPIAIGLDSLIQMLAINSGGTEISSTEFAPLFGKIVRASLVPEKDAFEMEDLFFIEKTRIQISELPNEKIIEIARKVNKLRLQGVSDDDIALEIQRSFQNVVNATEEEVINLKGEKHHIAKEKARVEIESGNIEKSLREHEVSVLNRKLTKIVFINWLKLLGIPIVITLSIILIIKLTSLNDKIGTTNNLIITSILTEMVASLLMYRFGKLKLTITKTDKDEIYKSVSKKVTEIKSKR